MIDVDDIRPGARFRSRTGRTTYIVIVVKDEHEFAVVDTKKHRLCTTDHHASGIVAWLRNADATPTRKNRTKVTAKAERRLELWP